MVIVQGYVNFELLSTARVCQSGIINKSYKININNAKVYITLYYLNRATLKYHKVISLLNTAKHTSGFKISFIGSR